MIDFLIKIPLDLVLSKDAATKNYHILPFPGEQEKPGPASKQAQIFFPGQTQYQEITLETGGRLIIIGDFILPPGTAPAGIITGELGDNIRNMNGFFYGIEIKNNSISVFTGMFNILPIFYYQGAQNLWIASKTHFITRMTDINPRINKRFILEQKLFNYPFFNDTPYLEIALLPANSYIQYQQGKVNIIQHTNIEDYFTTSPKPWKNSIESITALFLERVQDYFPDEPFYLSLTSGFDGRTLTACAKKYQKKFAAYAFGAHGTADLEIPKEQAAKLDIDFEPIYLDEQYAKNAFLTDGKELLDLTYEEVCFLTPVRSHGFCITFVGGQQQNLKGTVSFMRIATRNVAKSAVEMDVMELQNRVVIIAEGPMTAEQQQLVRKRTVIRPEKIIAAVKKLQQIHVHWKKIDLVKLEQEVRNVQPVFIDVSSEVDSTASNVEKKVKYTCYFPDGTTDSTNGGYDGAQAFKEKLKELNEKGFEFELQCDLEKEFVGGADTDEFVNACLMQFPYGVGGIHEQRQNVNKVCSVLNVWWIYLKNQVIKVLLKSMQIF